MMHTCSTADQPSFPRLCTAEKMVLSQIGSSSAEAQGSAYRAEVMTHPPCRPSTAGEQTFCYRDILIVLYPIVLYYTLQVLYAMVATVGCSYAAVLSSGISDSSPELWINP